MKKSFSLFLSPKVLGFSLFQVLFFSLMWISKTVHILYFEKQGAMVNFGASYSAMALAGYFSFLIGYLADILGFRKILFLGGILYSAGLFLRAYPDSFALAVSSGLIAGAGASCILCALRIWMLNIANDENTAGMVGIKSASTSLGTALGCVFAGLIPTFFVSSISLQWVLTGAGIGMGILTLIFYFRTPEIKSPAKTSVVSPVKYIKSVFNESRYLFYMTLVLGITTGFYVSFITPYLPLIMKDKGLSLYPSVFLLELLP